MLYADAQLPALVLALLSDFALLILGKTEAPLANNVQTALSFWALHPPCAFGTAIPTALGTPSSPPPLPVPKLKAPGC